MIHSWPRGELLKSGFYVRAYLECDGAQVILSVVEILHGRTVLVAVRFEEEPFGDTAFADPGPTQNNQPNALHVSHFHLLSFNHSVTESLPRFLLCGRSTCGRMFGKSADDSSAKLNLNDKFVFPYGGELIYYGWVESAT